MDHTKAILFDVDGTLLDVTDFTILATEYSLSKHGYPVPERDFINKQVGKSLPEYYGIFTGLTDSTHLHETHSQFQLENMHLSVPYPNTIKVLTTLRERGYVLAAVSSRTQVTLTDTLDQAGISAFFDTVVALEDVVQHKPDPEPVLKAVKKLGVNISEAVMIGDTYIDIEAGKNAGVKTIRVTYGFNSERLQDPKPDFIINEISELLGIFRPLKNNL